MKREKRNWIGLFILVLSIFLVINCSAVYAATAPTKMWVEPSSANNIPAQIDVFKAQTGGSTYNPTYTYQIYLPGNAVVENCFLSWDGDMQATVDNTTYTSGSCPIPPVSSQKNIEFKNGNKTVATFNVITYQGSSSVTPIFIDIDETYTTVENNGTVVHTIAAMDNDTNHNKYCKGTIYIDGEEYEMPQIKGRGNATWKEAKDKKPYNITLADKINFPGVDSPSTKKWTLLAENLDHSLLGNRSGYWLAHELGIGQDTASADVWMNGEYQGCYTVTPKYDSFVTKNGYLIEQDNYLEDSVANGGDPQFTLTGLKEASGWSSCYNRITVKKMGDNLLLNNGEVDESASNIENVANNTIKPWLQDAWDAIRSESGYNSKGKYYTEYIDIESFAKMYLLHEYVKSYDVCAGSIFYHRDGASDTDKLFAGPLWDLDNAMGSTYRNSDLGQADDRKNGDRRSGEGFFIPNVKEYKTSVYKTLSIHDDFMLEVKKQYNKYRSEFNGLAGVVEQMIEDIEASAKMNHMKVTDLGAGTGKNNHYYGSNTSLGYGIYTQNYLATTDSKTDWNNYAANLITYITTRSLWFENNTCTHEYQEVSGSAIAATCTEPGKQADQKCSICEHVVTGEEIEAKGHTEEIIPAVPATCTESGKTEGKKCSVCGTVLTEQETVAALGHDYQDVAGSARSATCLAAGKEIDKKCSRCGDVITGTTIPALGHDYGTPGYSWSADYSQMTATRTCSRDAGHVDTETVSATSLVTKQATCEEKGETTYTAVFTNSAFSTKTEVVANIDATGHQWGQASYAWSDDNASVTATRVCENDTSHVETESAAASYEVVTPATETAYGTGKYISDAFNNSAFAVQTKEVAIPPTGFEISYSWSADNSEVTGTAVPYDTSAATITETVSASYAVVKEATCTSTGTGAWTSAAISKDQFSVQIKEETIPMKAHTPATDAAVSATCTEMGLTEGSHCSVCGEVLTAQKTIASLGHNMVVVPGSAKDATCEEDGKEADMKCSRCNTLAAGKTIAATGHIFGTPSYTWAGDNSEVTATRTCANDTSHIETESAAATYEVVTPASETVSGTGRYTSAAFNNSAFAVQTKEVAIPPTGFEISYSWSADNSEVTGIAKPYAEGEPTVTETVKASFKTTKAATCTESGTGIWTSAAFNSSLFSVQTKDDTIPAAGHTEIALPAVAATCTEPGLTAGAKCSVCGVVITEQKAADPLGHIYEASFSWTGNDSDGYTAAVVTFECKNDSSHVATAEADITPPSESGTLMTYTATAVLDGKTYVDTKTVYVEPAPDEGDTPADGGDPGGGDGGGGGAGGGGGGGGGAAAPEEPEPEVPEVPLEPETPEEPEPTGEDRFTDVGKEDYYYEAVEWAAEKNITSGVSEDKFGPAMDCTRAQVVTFLWLASNAPDAGTETGFDDVDPSAYYDKAVAWAVKEGITAGTAKGEFSPNVTVTRAQFITMLWVSQGKPEVEIDLPFTDVSEDDYYAKAVAWAYANDITAGKSATLFGSDDPCTRGQIVVFLHQTFAEQE